jgi:hypothetical protein
MGPSNLRIEELEVSRSISGRRLARADYCLGMAMVHEVRERVMDL